MARRTGSRSSWSLCATRSSRSQSRLPTSTATPTTSAMDKPFLNAPGQRLENFTRVETFGDHQENGNNDVHWLKVIVDPRSREVFAYQTQIVPGNRTAVPAP